MIARADAALPATKLRRWWWLAVISFVISLIALAPAALLERAISPDSQVRFAADGGTIWNGRGRISVLTDTTPQTVQVVWKFEPTALLRLRLGFHVTADGPMIAGTSRVGLRTGSIELRASVITADAHALSAAHRLAAVFAPQGKLRLQQSDGESLTIDFPGNADGAWRVDGNMGLHAEQFVLGGFVNAAVGSHEIAIQGTGTTVNFSIPRSSGALKLEGAGSLTLASPRRFTFSGFATAASDAPASLKQLGAALPDGRQRLELNSPW
ncbi:MAG: type II secretion system protein N [Betaproteobacteria bacterium]